MLIEATLSLTCILLYSKTKLRSLLLASGALWLPLLYKPLIIILALVLVLLIQETGNLGTLK